MVLFLIRNLICIIYKAYLGFLPKTFFINQIPNNKNERTNLKQNAQGGHWL